MRLGTTSVRALLGAGVLVTAAAGYLLRPDASAPPFRPVPLGPGDEIRLGVPGAVNAIPSIAARWPFVVVAWVTTTAVDSAVYVSTSTDNGVSFSTPNPIEATRTRTTAGTALAPRVVLGWSKLASDGAPIPPDLHLVWQPDAESGEMRAVKSINGGQSFFAEAMDHDRPVDAPLETPRAPAAPQVATAVAVADAASTHPDATYDECGTLVVVWEDAAGGAPRVKMRRLVESPTGAQTALQTTVVSGASSAGYPRVASLLGGVMVAWTSGEVPAPAIALRRIGLESICQLQGAPTGRTSEAATP